MTIRLPALMPLVACALACAAVGGCAGLPRIDPTGERILIWPKDQPQTATLVATPTTIVAPPVTTDPVFPQAPVVATAPGAMATVPGVTPASLALAQLPQDKVSITPERILAPVNSEIVLKANVCTTNGFTLADQKVEWMLGRNGVGEFVEVSGKGWFHPPLLPWNKPNKVDNYLATGWTANSPLCVTRGTADPSDDVNVNRGDAWISVTSANEGTSFVTAVMPSVESWDTRRGTATIYWVDVQWVFPPTTITGSGRAETITTTVTRQTNGTPIEGWIVRYVVNDGGALSGGGQQVEMRTDAQGRASVQVSPTASGAASSRVDVELIRPAGIGGGDAPRLVIGTSSSIIQWSGGSTPYLPPSTTGSQPTTPVPALPDTFPSSPPSGWAPPSSGATAPPSIGGTTPPANGGTAPPASAARPQLRIEFEGRQTARVGEQAGLKFYIVNDGNATATNVKVIDRLDPGLAYASDPTATEVDLTPGPVGPSIAPGEQIGKNVPVEFVVNRGGRLCHNVSVQSAEGANATGQFCITATESREERTGQVRITIDGPVRQDVGQVALFRITVENVGQLPLVDVDVQEEYPTSQLRVQPSTDLNVRTASGRVSRTIPRLEAGQRRSWTTECLCLQPTLKVLPLPRASATTRTDPPTATLQNSDDHEMEIRAVNAQPGVGAAAGVVTPPGAASALGVNVLLANQPALVGARAACEVIVANKGAIDDENVVVRVLFPPELTPDVNAIVAPPNVQASLQGGTLTFTAVAILRPGEPLTYRIPMNVNAAGVVDIVAGAASRNVPLGASFTGVQQIINR